MEELNRIIMKYDKLVNWLLEQGGPAIQLRINNLQSEKRSNKISEKSVKKLLSIEEVNSTLNYIEINKKIGDRYEL